MGTHLDISGQQFGRLTVLHYLGAGKWLCRCTCGGTARCLTTNLKKGNSTSCGCLRRETDFKHGMSGTPMYRAWQAMLGRCENPNNGDYHNYGGRGIGVCNRWKEFANFLADMGMRPKGFDVDRRDNDGPYSPENCRWVSRQVNLNNQRRNNRVEFRGETKTVAEWAEVVNMHEETLRRRILNGWPAERALTEPTRNKNPSGYSFRQRPSGRGRKAASQ